MECKKNTYNQTEQKLSGISLLNLGKEGFVVVKNYDEPTIPNSSGVFIQSLLKQEYRNDLLGASSIQIIDDNEDNLNMLRLFYLGGISFTGLYLFYRIYIK